MTDTLSGHTRPPRRHNLGSADVSFPTNNGAAVPSCDLKNEMSGV
jgi:hypothetical protein